MNFSSRLHKIVDRVYLIYLGLLPVGATFAVTLVYGREQIFGLFLGGIVLVSVYLAVVASYTPFPRKPWLTVISFLDGPLIALLAQRFGSDLYGWIINSFLVDGLAIWIVIAFLAVSTNRPTGGQRAATLLFGLVAVGSLIYLIWPYWINQLWGDWNRLFWLVVGAVEAFSLRYFLLDRDKVLRDNDFSSGFIIVFLLLWLAALITGNVIHAL